MSVERRPSESSATSNVRWVDCHRKGRKTGVEFTVSRLIDSDTGRWVKRGTMPAAVIQDSQEPADLHASPSNGKVDGSVVATVAQSPQEIGQEAVAATIDPVPSVSNAAEQTPEVATAAFVRQPTRPLALRLQNIQVTPGTVLEEVVTTGHGTHSSEAETSSTLGRQDSTSQDRPRRGLGGLFSGFMSRFKKERLARDEAVREEGELQPRHVRNIPNRGRRAIYTFSIAGLVTVLSGLSASGIVDKIRDAINPPLPPSGETFRRPSSPIKVDVAHAALNNTSDVSATRVVNTSQEATLLGATQMAQGDDDDQKRRSAAVGKWLARAEELVGARLSQMSALDLPRLPSPILDLVLREVQGVLEVRANSIFDAFDPQQAEEEYTRWVTSSDAEREIVSTAQETIVRGQAALIYRVEEFVSANPEFFRRVVIRPGDTLWSFMRDNGYRPLEPRAMAAFLMANQHRHVEMYEIMRANGLIANRTYPLWPSQVPGIVADAQSLIPQRSRPAQDTLNRSGHWMLASTDRREYDYVIPTYDGVNGVWDIFEGTAPQYRDEPLDPTMGRGFGSLQQEVDAPSIDREASSGFAAADPANSGTSDIFVASNDIDEDLAKYVVLRSTEEGIIDRDEQNILQAVETRRTQRIDESEGVRVLFALEPPDEELPLAA